MNFACLLRKTPFGAAYTGGSEDMMYTYWYGDSADKIIKNYEKGEVSPMNNLKEKKMDNKGFSLVELIIVIAIMAVLIGVLAPQYLRYVERSRQSADIDNVDQMISAVEIYAADPVDGATVTGTITCSGGVVTPSSGTPAKGTVKDALDKAGITVPTTQLMKSAAYQDWVITFSDTDPMMSFSTSDDGPALKAALGR